MLQERNRIRKVANMNIVWKYLGSTVRLVGIGPIDIVDGNTTLTLGMIWSLIVFFMAKVSLYILVLTATSSIPAVY
jgi:hypothetical protein